MNKDSKSQLGIDNKVYPYDDEVDSIVAETKNQKETEESFNLQVLTPNGNHSGKFDDTSNKDRCNSNDEFVVKRERRWQIRYETLVWIVFMICSVLILIDRFTGNGDRIFGKKNRMVHRLTNENWGLTISNYIWAATARMIIVSQNLMFYTTLWCIPNILADFAPRWIQIDGIRDVNIKLHRICGTLLVGIPTIAHVFLIFIPPFIDKTKLHYHPPSEYNYSKQPFHLNWTRIYDPAAVDGFGFSRPDGLHITSDEIYRFLIVVVLFFILFPISRSKWLNDRSYSFAMIIHGFAGFWYAIDNVRKMSHALSWVFNIPLMIVWLIDRMISVTHYRKSEGVIAKKRIIGKNEYVDIRVKLSKQFKRTVGDVYYLLEDGRRSKRISLERSHPFTSFSNHTEDKSWDIGFIITVVEDHLQSSPAWTRRLTQINESQGEIKLQCWGPYRSSANELYKELLLKETISFVLLASGSGYGYISDALSILAYKMYEVNYTAPPSIDIHYSGRSFGLLQNFDKEIQEKLEIIHQKNIAKVNFNWYLTQNEEIEFDYTDINVIKGRVNYERIIQRCPHSCSIYFTGRPTISDMIETYASKHDKRFVKDYVNNQKGLNDKQIMFKYLKYTFWCVLVIAFFCVVFSIYLKQ